MPLSMPTLPLDAFIDVAAFRAALQHFTRESARITKRFGLTPQRYLLLLMIKGAADGSQRSTVTELSQRLQLAQHTVTELATRTERAGLIRRTVSTNDRRIVYLSLTPEGEQRLAAAFTGLENERQVLRAVISRTRP